MAVKKLKKGELLFSEGEPSKSMYFIQRGSLRLYKKKGAAPIEIGLIHSGEMVGEMGFLDGGPRSASAEALQDVDLLEITSDKMQDQLKVLPPWLIVLLKTVVNRLRGANTKIRQLESATTAITYGRDGATKHYAFLNNYSLMKICLSIMGTASRSTEKSGEGYVRLRIGQVQKYANNILGEHLSKIMETIEILGRAEILKINRTQDAKGAEKVEVFVRDIDMLDHFLNFINEENLKEASKKMTFSARGVAVLLLVDRYLANYPADAEGISSVNMAEIVAKEKETNGGKEPYLADEFNELVRNKVATELSLSDSKTAITKIHVETFKKVTRVQKILRDVDMVNESKRLKSA